MGLWAFGSAMIVANLGATNFAPQCELGPGFGRGSSTRGQIEELNSVGASCDWPLLSFGELWLGPKLAVRDTKATLYAQSTEGLTLQTFQSRALSLGVTLGMPLTSRWGSHVTLDYGQGRGSLWQSYSTSTLQQNLDFAGLSDKQWRGEIGVSYRLNSLASLVFAVDESMQTLRWNPSGGRFSSESVSSDKRLSLSSNTLLWRGPETTGQESLRGREFRMAIRISFTDL